MKKIIISGKKQSGKSTLRDYLTRDAGLDCQLFSFADYLKESLSVIFGLELAKMNGTNEQKNELTHIKWADIPLPKEKVHEVRVALNALEDTFVTYRGMMVLWGTYICRAMDGSCWAKATINKMQTEEFERYIDGSFLDYAIIDDARFPNEIEELNDKNTIFIRLQRNEYNSKDRSETALDDFDWRKTHRHIIVPNQSMTIEQKNHFVLNHPEFIAFVQAKTKR